MTDIDYGTLGPPINLDDPNNPLTGNQAGQQQQQEGEHKQWAPAIKNPAHVTPLFERAGGWVVTYKDKETGQEKYLLNLSITLKPGDYHFNEGDTLDLTGFQVKEKKSEKSPDLFFKVAEPRTGGGGRGLGGFRNNSGFSSGGSGFGGGGFNNGLQTQEWDPNQT